jgi:hypothetical protein
MSRENDFISEIKDNYKEAVDGWSEIYDAASDDTKFVYEIDEGQWPESVRRARQADGRPIITSNKLQKILRRIRGDGMMNRPSLKVIPVDSNADVNMASLYSGILREIEYLSAADIVYDTAYNHAISSSIGFWRLITKYADENSFDQDIRLSRIINPLSVHLDPMAQDFNFEDAKYAFVDELIKKDRYKKLYPKAEAHDFDSSTTTDLFGDWLQGDNVRVAEYFYKDTTSKKIGLLEDDRIIELNKENIDIATVLGHKIIRERTVESDIIKWCKTNGVEKLEESIWPGKYIPIIPMFGDEIVVNGKRYYISLARGAKGSQQMYNYWATAATETVALAPKMPFIVDHRQIKGFENEWNDANLHNRMFIRFNSIQGIQKPQRENQAQVPTAIMNMMQSTAYDIEDHLGQYESSKGETSNERSGKAIIARVQQSDKGTYLFVNNRTRSMIYGGRQIIDLIPKIYDTQRAMQILGDDGQHSLVEVNKPVPDGMGGVKKENDLSVGKFDLIASIGASYSSMRQEMTETMISAMQYAPDIAPVIAPLIFKYSDAPGAQEIYSELTKAMQQMQAQTQVQPK